MSDRAILLDEAIRHTQALAAERGETLSANQVNNIAQLAVCIAITLRNMDARIQRAHEFGF